MSRLLVIGGSGFFGKSILDAYSRNLLAPWNIHEIIILSRYASNLKITHPWLINENIKLVNDDISTCNEVPEADIVIHAAASTDAANYKLNPLREKANIEQGTVNYVRLAKIFHRNSKILYVSSGAVYGDQPNYIENIPELETSLRSSSSDAGKDIYATAKVISETYIKELGNSGLEASIARCFAFIGPHLPRMQNFAIGNFIQNGLDQKPIIVKASSTVYRSYMHSDDLVRWLMKIVHTSAESVPIFNVGSDESITIHELAHKIGSHFNVEVISPNISKKIISRYVPSIEKAKKELGLYLELNLDQAINITIKNISKNET